VRDRERDKERERHTHTHTHTHTHNDVREMQEISREQASSIKHSFEKCVECDEDFCWVFVFDSVQIVIFLHNLVSTARGLNVFANKWITALDSLGQLIVT